MVYYRIYQLRGPRNEVESFHEFDAESDCEAIAVGEAMRRSNAMELWSGRRKVQRWPALTPNEADPELSQSSSS